MRGEKVKKYVAVALLRDKRQRISYTSGLTYFSSAEEMHKHTSEFIKRGFEIVEVDVQTAHPPETTGRGIWCPYCQRWELWVKDEGYTVCPLCGMTNKDFYVKRFNRLER